MGRLEQIQGAVHATLKGDWPRLVIVVAGHNGAGKTTLWYSCLANELQLPLLNADRMLLLWLRQKMPKRWRCRAGSSIAELQSLSFQSNLPKLLSRRGTPAAPC